jgi:hypothetical protein
MILTPLTAAETATEEARVLAEGWIKRSLVAFDQFINVTLFRGRNDETISAHAGRACIEGRLWGETLATFLNIFQVNHCVKAMVGDAVRAKAILQTEQQSGEIAKV